MRTAVLAEIHANLEALQVVLQRIHELGVDEIVCLGDIQACQNKVALAGLPLQLAERLEMGR